MLLRSPTTPAALAALVAMTLSTIHFNLMSTTAFAPATSNIRMPVNSMHEIPSVLNIRNSAGVPVPSPELRFGHPQNRLTTQRKEDATRLSAISLPTMETIRSVGTSLFRRSGPVPLLQSFGLNAFLFAIFKSKLFKMLTPAGTYHNMYLPTI